MHGEKEWLQSEISRMAQTLALREEEIRKLRRGLVINGTGTVHVSSAEAGQEWRHGMATDHNTADATMVVHIEVHGETFRQIRVHNRSELSDFQFHNGATSGNFPWAAAGFFSPGSEHKNADQLSTLNPFILLNFRSF